MKKKINFFTLSRLWIYLFFAFFPFQIKTLIITDNIYPSGFFNPYLSHFIYITDVFFVISVICFALGILFNKSEKSIADEFKDKSKYILFILIVLFLIFHFVSILFSSAKLNSGLHSFRILEYAILSFFIFLRFVPFRNVLYVFIGSMTVSSIIGIFQFLFQKSLGLNFLGESVISSDKLGVAKILLNNENSLLRIYGTFPHPNIFAGALISAIFFIIYLLKKSKRILYVPLFICILALILTFSRSGIFALLVGLFLYFVRFNLKSFLKYLIVFLSLGIFLIFAGEENSVSERVTYLSASKNILMNQPFGIGAGNFTNELQNYLDNKLPPWQIQPVHNIFLLEFNELGIQGGIIFLIMTFYIFYYLIRKKIRNNNLDNKRFISLLVSLGVFVFIIGLFDHYFVSLPQGEILFWLFIGLLGNAE